MFSIQMYCFTIHTACLKLITIALFILIGSLEELDAIKKEQSSERGRNTRPVHRFRRELLADSGAMPERVALESGGTRSIVINKYLRCIDEV